MLYNMCHIPYVMLCNIVMLCYITCNIQHVKLLYNMRHVMLYNMFHVMLYYICHVM